MILVADHRITLVRSDLFPVIALYDTSVDPIIIGIIIIIACMTSLVYDHSCLPLPLRLFICPTHGYCHICR